MTKIETFSTVCKTAETPSGKFRVVIYADAYNLDNGDFEYFDTYHIELFKDSKQNNEDSKLIEVDDIFFDRFADLIILLKHEAINISDLFNLIFATKVNRYKFTYKDLVDLVQLLNESLETNLIKQTKATERFYNHAQGILY